MPTLWITLVLALLPVPIVYLFYYRYFNVKPSYLRQVEHFSYGSILAIIILLVARFFPEFPGNDSTAVSGFIKAALVEKGSAFVVIFILSKIQRHELMVMNFVTSAMLIGLGFATIENIMYALTIRETVIIVRLLSSVPLHVLTCGLIGYHIAVMELYRSPGIRVRRFMRAIIVPVLFHGLYDTLLLTGGTLTYWIAPLLVALIMLMEFILSKSQILPLAEGLQKHRLALEDWATIQREPQYERWILRSMGSKIKEHVPFFRLRMSPTRAVVIILLFAASASLLFAQDIVINMLRHHLRHEEATMVFSLLPSLYALNLFAIGVVNPKYFRYSLIRIPIIIDVDAALDGSVVKTITYHVTTQNCYLKTVDPLPKGISLSLTFNCAGIISPAVHGVALWDSHDDQKQLSGTLIRFTNIPPAFRLFLIRYYFYRITRGITFNLRLPGFANIRRLFVRPISVMQSEWRYPAGQRLFEQGDPARFFYLIRKGEVDILKRLETGEEVFMTTLREGDIFGEMAIVGNQPRLATAVCRTDCLLAVAEADNLDALIQSNPVFALRLIKTFANRLHSSEEKMLKNIAGMDQEVKLRDKLCVVLIHLTRALSAAQGGSSEVRSWLDIDTISKQTGVEKITAERIVDAVLSTDGNMPLDEILKIIRNGTNPS